MSFAEQVTGVVPIENVVPDRLQVTAAAFPYSSVAVGNVAVAPVELVAAYVRSDVLLNVGGIVPGLTVTENEVWVALSPARFTALQSTVVTPIGNVEPDVNPPVDAQVTASDPSAKSVAVGVVHDSTAPAELVAVAVMPVGVPTITGAASFTVTVNVVGIALSPAASCALQVTVVIPIGNVEPDAGMQDTASVPSTKSVAVGEVYATAVPNALVAVIPVMSDEAPITGAASLTVTVNVVDAVFSYGSVAVQVTVVVPIANVEPDVGEQDTGTDAPYSSVAVGAVYVSVEPAEVAAATGSI
jgi:hypothetical protein